MDQEPELLPLQLLLLEPLEHQALTEAEPVQDTEHWEDQELELPQPHQPLPLLVPLVLQLQELELDTEPVLDMEHQQAAVLQALNQVPHMDNQLHHMVNQAHPTDNQDHHTVKLVHQQDKDMVHLIKEQPELLAPLENLALADQELAHLQVVQLTLSKLRNTEYLT